MTDWTREHDRLIAEKIEGEVIYTGHPNKTRVDGGYILNDPAGVDIMYSDCSPIPHYNTDIAACVRAAEKLRKTTGKMWIIESADDRRDLRSFANICEGEKVGVMEYQDTPVEALAWALWGVAKETK